MRTPKGPFSPKFARENARNHYTSRCPKRAAPNRIIATYKSTSGLDWFSIRETVIPAFSRLISPLYFDDVLISARVRAQVDIYKSYFQVNVVLPYAETLAAINRVVRDALPEQLGQLSDADARHISDRVYGFPQNRRIAHMAGYIMGISPALIASLNADEFKDFFTYASATSGIASTIHKACARIAGDVIRELRILLKPPNPGLAHVFLSVLTWSMVNKMMGASFMGLADHKAGGKEYAALSLKQRMEHHSTHTYDQSVTCVRAYNPLVHRPGSDEEYRNRIGIAFIGGSKDLDAFKSRILAGFEANIDFLQAQFDAYMDLVPSEFVVISDTNGIFRDEHLKERFVASIKLLESLNKTTK